MTLLPDWDTDHALWQRIHESMEGSSMEDSGDKKELPCPTCGEESTNGEQCELCIQEAASDADRLARRLTKNTLDKYPPLPPFGGMGSGMP